MKEQLRHVSLLYWYYTDLLEKPLAATFVYIDYVL